MAFERKYSDETRTKSVETVVRRRQDEPGNRGIIREVAEEYDVGQQSLRQWLARYDDGSYDYSDAPSSHLAGAESVRHGGQSRQELLQQIAHLERRIAVLEEDNRSLNGSSHSSRGSCASRISVEHDDPGRKTSQQRWGWRPLLASVTPPDTGCRSRPRSAAQKAAP